MKKVCFISHLHICLNPRLRKEAFTLSRNGYDVTILTLLVSPEKYREDLRTIEGTSIKYEAVVQLRSGTPQSMEDLVIKVGRKTALLAKRFLGFESSWLLGGVKSKRFVRRALEINADLYIAHLEFGFFIGKKLIEKKRKVAFDFEDWYSRDYLVANRPVRLLQSLEHFALQFGEYCSCPSVSMANAIQQAYKSKKPIHIIYNGFSQKESLDTANISREKKSNTIVWFSQTIGPGRGLETLCKALHFVDEVAEIHLLGMIDKKFREELSSIFPFNKGHKLEFHSPVTHDELCLFLQRFSTGLALEERQPESRDKTITNKVLQYLQAGLQVIATRTEGQVELSGDFRQGMILIPSDEQTDWSKTISACLHTSHPGIKEQVHIFNQKYSWEAQETTFLQLVNKAIIK